MPQGFFSLQKPEDLLAKLEHDYDRLCQDPIDVYAAFDFFVTADHIPDWLMEDGRIKKTNLNKYKYKNVITRICFSLSTGAKHFSPRDPNAKYVQDMEIDSFVERDLAEPGLFEENLYIYIDKKTVKEVTEFARTTLEFWKNHVLFNVPPEFAPKYSL